jgi:hypothetical protein
MECVDKFKYDGDLMDSKGTYYTPNWAINALENGVLYYKDGELYIYSIHGDKHVSVGDYIAKGIYGEIAVIK